MLGGQTVALGPFRASLRGMTVRRSWPEIMERLNRKPGSQIRLAMGTPGSAQVTRCRLLAQWTNLEAWTVGPVLFLRLKN